MAFMLKKKRYKFQVDLCLEELSEVSYSKAILFAKVRQLEGGSFTDVSKRMEVRNHRVQYSARYLFPCKMNANASSGVLETCKCRVSIRMEEKGGRHFRKLGFVDINLAEYAGAGPSTQRYILQPYDLSHRLDNSIVKVSINITLREGDTIFQRPLTRQQPIVLPGEEPSHADDASLTSSIPTKSSGSSLAPPGAQARGNLALPSHNNHGDNLVKQSSSNHFVLGGIVPEDLGTHTRNSSATSQASQASQTSQASVGYASQNSQPGVAAAGGHSRHSSSGESSHARTLFSTIFNRTTPRRSTSSNDLPELALPRSQLSSPARLNLKGGAQPLFKEHNSSISKCSHCGGRGFVVAAAQGGGHRRTRSEFGFRRNMSADSSDTGFFGGSLEKEKRRKQQKLDEGRIDAEKVINELMEGVDLDKVGHEDAETSGLQLYVSKDGSVTFDKRNSSRADLQPVVIEGPR